MTKGRRRIEMFFGIRAKPASVFEALTSPEILCRWFTDSARIEPRKGGEYSFEWKGGYHHEGRVLECRPARSLILAWPQDGKPSRVAFWLTSVKGGTILRFRQTGLPRDSVRRLSFLGLYSGWVYYLSNLRAVIETDRDLRRPQDRYW